MHSNQIKRVLISVTDKTGVVEFARALAGLRRGNTLDRRHRSPAAHERHRR